MATLGLKGMGKFLQTQGSHSKVHWENAKRSLMKSGLNAMPLFLLDNLLSQFGHVMSNGCCIFPIPDPSTYVQNF